MTPAALKQARASLRLTQRQMAERLGMTREHYVMIERGHNAITPRTKAQVEMMLQLAERQP